MITGPWNSGEVRFLTSDPCPRCGDRLWGDRDGDRVCKHCLYKRPAPSADSKIVGIYGSGNIDVYRARIDHLLLNINLGQVFSAPEMAIAEHYAHYREVNFHCYTGGPKLALPGIDYVISIGHTNFLPVAKELKIPVRLLT